MIINQWIQNNKLYLNIEKTNYMILSHPHKQYLINQSNLNGDSVSRVNGIEFLGVSLLKSIRALRVYLTEGF